VCLTSEARLRTLPNTARRWLLDNGYEDVAKLIDQVIEAWKAEGNGTRRNWWEVLAGHKDGKPSVIHGITFPVLLSARLRQGLPVTIGCLRRSKKERIPPVRKQARWQTRERSDE
jgi:hypothetical protein